MSEMGNSTIAKADAAGGWLVHCERRLEGNIGTGEARLSSAPPDPAKPPYANLAGGRAWLALGQARLAAGDFKGAIVAARGGLDELGEDYRATGVKDDTRLKLDAAEERIAEGRADAGARVFVRVLDARIGLFLGAHPDVR